MEEILKDITQTYMERQDFFDCESPDKAVILLNVCAD